MIRILTADDHAVVRQGLRNIVAAEPDLEVVDEAIDGPSALELARSVAHDVVLLDLSMPRMSGFDVLRELKTERPDVPVVILTMHKEHQFAIRALKSGASGYLIKDASPGELVAAIRRVVTGGRYLGAGIAEVLATHLSDRPEKQPHETLSDREYQVLRLIASGKPTRQIAHDLGLSVKTIATYRGRIFEKMKLKTTAELAAYVVRHELGKSGKERAEAKWTDDDPGPS